MNGDMNMANGIGIIVKKEDKEYLDTLKEHPRETYGDIIHKLIECWNKNDPRKEIVDKEFVTPGPNSPTGIKEPILDDSQNPDNISTE